ncbi:MAG: hypothetical protein K8F30_08120 [Taibaiella sp.]|nr:hypothetical protein [Taibaiella sp.]
MHGSQIINILGARPGICHTLHTSFCCLDPTITEFSLSIEADQVYLEKQVTPMDDLLFLYAAFIIFNLFLIFTGKRTSNG